MFIFLWLLCVFVAPPLGFLAALGLDWAASEAVSLVLSGARAAPVVGWDDLGWDGIKRLVTVTYVAGGLQALIGGFVLAALSARRGAKVGLIATLLGGALLGVGFAAVGYARPDASGAYDVGAFIAQAVWWGVVHAAAAFGCWMLVRTVTAFRPSAKPLAAA